MKFTPTELPEIIVIEPDVFRDVRGFFLESYHERKYCEGGIDVRFVQDNHSCSTRDTLRGLHAQVRRPQGKLIRVLRGAIHDVAVDVRRGSPSYRRWVAVTLTAEEFRQCYIPPGFAHGFCVLSDVAEVEYKCTDYYDPTDELRILWNDPAIGVRWPVTQPVLSEKDRVAPLLQQVEAILPKYGAV